jgi:hypothetical protein
MASGHSAATSAQGGGGSLHGIREIVARYTHRMSATCVARTITLDAGRLPMQTQDSIPSPVELNRLSVEQVMETSAIASSKTSSLPISSELRRFAEIDVSRDD